MSWLNKTSATISLHYVSYSSLVYTNSALSTMENSKHNQGTEQLRQELQRQEILYLLYFKELFSGGEDIHFSDGFGVLSYPFIYVAKRIIFLPKQSPNAVKKASSFVVILSKIVLLTGYKKKCGEGKKRLV